MTLSIANENTTKPTILTFVPALITVWLQARVRADHLRYEQEITFTMVAGTSPFIRFNIQLYHAFLITISLRHGQLHHVGDDHVFRCALYWPQYQATPRRSVKLSPVPESQVEDKGDETSHTVVARKR